MATNKQPIFLNAVISSNNEIVNADGTSTSVVYTAGSDGGSITNLTATTDDTVDVIVVLSSNDGAQINVLGEVTVTAGAGTDGATPAVNLLDATAMPGVFQNDGSYVLGASETLLVNAKSAVTAAKVLSISAKGGSYSV
jgi:hypothetical protein